MQLCLRYHPLYMCLCVPMHKWGVGVAHECIVIAELEIMVGHRTFSVHIAQISEHSCVCADIMSRHSLEQ